MESRDSHDYLCAGEYLGYRLLELGVTHVFNVPGDFNLPLLDSLAKVPDLTLVNTSNELNAAYAADGFARATGGLGCCATTFLVRARQSRPAETNTLQSQSPTSENAGPWC
eukprot:GHRQ01010463.1.p2 GENE.GHRQ01010463.1~~GHRQ01010463.1.p2  ORF type:complete len:111 (+),score=7.14 GHRQ01010463.1:231-563(+)